MVAGVLSESCFGLRLADDAACDTGLTDDCSVTSFSGSDVGRFPSGLSGEGVIVACSYVTVFVVSNGGCVVVACSVVVSEVSVGSLVGGTAVVCASVAFSPATSVLTVTSQL